MKRCRTSLVLSMVFAAAAACRTSAPAGPQTPPAQPQPPISPVTSPAPSTATSPATVPAEPPAAASAALRNDDRLGGVLWVQTSAEYRALAGAAFARARVELDRALADRTATAALEQQEDWSGLPPAVIADVDETLLDNSPYEADRIRVGGRYEAVSWNAWVQRASARAVPGALEFARYAAERGVTLFYVTNRAAALEEKTRENLAALGFPLAEDRDTVLTPGERPEWSSEKASRRAEVARSFRILLLIGDDLGDFVTGARALPEERIALAERYAQRWQSSWILLANPYYGSWERALLENRRDLSDEEILRRKLERLRGSE